MIEKYDDIFLVRWMANELSEQELKAFEASKDYSQYKQIVDELEHARFPEYDLETNFEATLQKIEAQNANKTVKRLWPIWIGSAAACLLLCLSLFFFFKQTRYTTQLAQQLNFELPDGSQVDLNPDSQLAHGTFNWEHKRTLDLKGEAYFKVKKGKTFTVNTSQGTVTVLGTQFLVNSRANYCNIICYEGRVKVSLNNIQSQVLTQGQAVHLHNGILETYTTTHKTPTWLSQESSFYNTPILEVIHELERQYNITIAGKTHVKPAQFNGRFSHNNLELALKTVFISMDIPYTYTNHTNVTIKKY